MDHASVPGVVRCLKCLWLFVSPDRERIRRCRRCKGRERNEEPRRATLRIEGLSDAVRQELEIERTT